MIFSLQMVRILPFMLAVFMSLAIPFHCLGQEEDPVLEDLRASVRNNTSDVAARMRLVQHYGSKYRATGSIYHLENGIRDAIEVLRLAPTNEEAHSFLSMALMQEPLNQLPRFPLDELLKAQEKLIAAEHDVFERTNLIPYQYFHAISLNRSRTDQQISELREAIRLKPGFAMSHFFLGLAYYRQQRFDLALFETEEGIRLDPKAAGGHDLKARIHNKRVSSITNCLDDREVDAGIRSAKEAVRLDPQNGDYHLLLGDLYIDKGLYDLAVFEMREAVRLGGEDFARASLGYALFMNGQYRDGWEKFAEARNTKRENNTDLLRLLAWSSLMAGSPKNAEDFSEKYLSSPSVVLGGWGEWGYKISSVMLCRYLALRQEGKAREASELLTRYSVNYIDDILGYHITQYFLGQVSEEYLLARAIDRCEEAQVAFYIGYDHFLNGEKDGARKSLEKAAGTKGFSTLEYSMALGMLQELERGQEGK